MKNIFLFLIIAISSYSVFANDREITNRACPEGTYRSSGRMGEGCCTKDNLYIYGSEYQYTDISPEGCGCPKGGKPTNNGGCCSEDGYAFDPYDSMKYDKYQPSLCCPFGGKRVATGECCKDNYEFNIDTNKYDLVNGHCGCPNGAIPAPREWAGDLHCCKDGFALGSSGHANKSNFEHVWVELCGCPQNGIPVIWEPEHANECCTSDRLYRFVLDAYDDYRPDLCKHPDAARLMKEWYEKQPADVKLMMKLFGT